MVSAPCNSLSISSSFTREDVLKALKTAPKIQDWQMSSVSRLGDDLVVKYGEAVHLFEAWNLMLAASIPGIRVPKVYDAWEIEEAIPRYEETRTTGYLVMQYIPGNTLSSVWPSLDSEARAKIYQQISSGVRALHQHKLTSPGPVGGGISQGWLFTDYNAGPFQSVSDMEAYFNERQRVCKDFRRIPEDEIDFSGSFNELVFCHFDLHLRNFILDHEGNIWFIDWGHAGGYPVYFEEAQMAIIVDREHPEFSASLLEMTSTHAHEHDVKRIRSLGFALTTGALLMPRGSQDVHPLLR